MNLKFLPVRMLLSFIVGQAGAPGRRELGPQLLRRYFVGSESCKGCHAEAYNGWKNTRMANVIRDPKMHPDAVLGDFTHANPLRPFGVDEVAFVYGRRYKQRYFTKKGDDYLPCPHNET